MNAAKLRTSPRLQRVLNVLRDGAEHSTMDLIRSCAVCAVNSVIAELRTHGFTIICRQDSSPERARRGRRWLYRLVTAARRAARVELPATVERRAVTLIYA